MWTGCFYWEPQQTYPHCSAFSCLQLRHKYAGRLRVRMRSRVAACKASQSTSRQLKKPRWLRCDASSFAKAACHTTASQHLLSTLQPSSQLPAFSTAIRRRMMMFSVCPQRSKAANCSTNRELASKTRSTSDHVYDTASSPYNLGSAPTTPTHRYSSCDYVALHTRLLTTRRHSFADSCSRSRAKTLQIGSCFSASTPQTFTPLTLSEPRQFSPGTSCRSKTSRRRPMLCKKY